MIRLPAWAALVLAAFAPGTAAAASPSAAVAAFERFIGTSAPICSRQPSAACVEVGWSFTDADRSGELSLREFEAVRTALSNWTIWRDDNLNAREQSSIALGLWVIEMIGLDTLSSTATMKITAAGSRGPSSSSMSASMSGRWVPFSAIPTLSTWRRWRRASRRWRR